MVVLDFLEVIAATGHTPIRVKEGFLMKESGQWYLAEWPPEIVYKPFCFGGSTSYYIVGGWTGR
jgi:hypothetical protein